MSLTLLRRHCSPHTFVRISLSNGAFFFWCKLEIWRHNNTDNQLAFPNCSYFPSTEFGVKRLLRCVTKCKWFAGKNHKSWVPQETFLFSIKKTWHILKLSSGGTVRLTQFSVLLSSLCLPTRTIAAVSVRRKHGHATAPSISPKYKPS